MINTATEHYQVIRWTQPKYGIPLIYSIHIVPETVYKDKMKSYQRTIIHYPGKMEYSTIIRKELNSKLSYYVIVYANNGIENTPSEVKTIHHPFESQL